MKYYLMFKRINNMYPSCNDTLELFKAVYELIKPGSFEVSKDYLNCAEMYYGTDEWKFISRFVTDTNFTFTKINGVIVICK